MYECISETEFAAVLPENAFLPNYYVDITPFMSTKLELIQIYKSEIGQHPFPRSLERLGHQTQHSLPFLAALLVDLPSSRHLTSYSDILQTGNL